MILNEDNFLRVTLGNYNNSQLNTIEEFSHDLSRIGCVKRVLDRYNSSGKINLRLLLNHIIILHNSFDDITPMMLKHKIPEALLSPVKSVMLYLGYIAGSDWVDIKEDEYVHKELRKL